MGMTIDEAVKSISDIDKAYRTFSDNEYQALNVAVETMRKYQKIQEIIAELNGDFYGSYLKDRQTLEKIYGVVEDGKID